MRTLAIGDIHGCFTALTTLSDAVEITPDDLVVTLGDYVDRGPNSYGVMEWLIARSRTGNLVALSGNHEKMMLQARGDPKKHKEWLEYGGDTTLASYSPFDDSGKLLDVPDEHWSFLKTYCRDWFESDSNFFVHASAHPHLGLDEQPDYLLFWEPFGEPAPHESGKIMICGHTPQKSGKPKHLGHATCIDTWVYGRGWLTCLEVGSTRYWQANEAGEVRRGVLGQ